MVHTLHPWKLATLLASILLMMFCWDGVASAQTWTTTGSLGTARYGGASFNHGLVLPSGKVLIALLHRSFPQQVSRRKESTIEARK